MLPLVSVIIPTYNRSHLLGETLDSLIAQTYNNWECIVVDDGSEDYTAELMHFYLEIESRLKFYSRPISRIRGGNAARNYGFERSKGEFIQWFDSDNRMLPDKLDLKVKALLKDEEADFVVCQNAEIINEQPLIVKEKWPIKEPGDVLFNHLTGVIAFDTNGPLFRKKFLEGRELFRESMLIGQDWEFFSRLLVYRPKILYIYQVLYHLRTLGEGVRNTKTKEKIRSKIYGEIALFDLIKKAKYFKETRLRREYDKMVFYRILSRYQYLKKNFSKSESVKYLEIALPNVGRTFYWAGIKKLIWKKGNLKNFYKILTG